jgi:uncharacterized cupredoxin-like copper-binding protein
VSQVKERNIPKLRRRLIALAALLALTSTPALASAFVTTDQVKMLDFKFVLSAKTVKRGKVVFKLKNAGAATHNIKVAGKTSKLLNPGQISQLTVTFTKAGKYKYLCTIPGHAALGMKGVLTVK